MKLAGKMLTGFGTITLLLVVSIGFSFFGLTNLRTIQDEGSVRAQDALFLGNLKTRALRVLRHRQGTQGKHQGDILARCRGHL